MNPNTYFAIGSRVLLPKSLALALSVLLLTGCSGEAATPTEPKTVAPSPIAAKDMQVIVAPDSLRSRLRVEVLADRPWFEMLRVSGVVRLDEQRVARIGTTVTGRIEQIFVQPGDRVTRGQVLATLNSTELAQAQLGYLKALSGRQLKAREAQRARTLVESGVISEAELQRRENESQELGYEVSALEDQLRVLGMSPEAIRTLAKTRKINSSASLVAGIAGTVIERNIVPGQVVQVTDDAFKVADLSQVWVVAEVPEQTASALSLGQRVEINFPALGDAAPRTGDIIHISAVVNPQTRTIAVRSEVDNADGRLKPDMLAQLQIRTRQTQALVVPVSAIVRENNADFVFVEQADGAFRLRPVQLGAVMNKERPIRDGVQPGERVVVEGAFHLNNERRRQELE